jgi:hypothetical protein
VRPHHSSERTPELRWLIVAAAADGCKRRQAPGTKRHALRRGDTSIARRILFVVGVTVRMTNAAPH